MAWGLGLVLKGNDQHCVACEVVIGHMYGLLGRSGRPSK